MKRYEKNVLETEEGITYDVSEGTSGESTSRNLDIDKANIYVENYANPPIPEGYKHICGEWNNGFVIERCSDGSQFVWIPVGILDSNGTLDGTSFTEQFGRRNYLKWPSFGGRYNEPLTDEFVLQIESVKKYGGFYISRYTISENDETGKPQSIQGAIPWVGICFNRAQKVASSMEDNETVKSHLTGSMSSF